jgi:hypothetical protein
MDTFVEWDFSLSPDTSLGSEFRGLMVRALRTSLTLEQQKVTAAASKKLVSVTAGLVFSIIR